VVLNQSDGSFLQPAIIVGVVLALAAAAILAFGLASPWLVLLAIAAGVAILGLSSLLDGFW
jgi:hypothetical protein